MMTYTSQSLIEAFLERSLTTNELKLLNLIGDAIEGYINDQLGIGFGNVSATTRYYDGGSRIIDIDPCIDITKVEYVDNDETELHEYTLNEDFEARPRNETVKTYIEKRVYSFPKGVANIGITAKFTRGTTIPNDIQWLATYLAGRLFSQEVKGDLKSESIEGYSRTFKEFVADNSQASMVLNKYIEDEVLI